MKILPIDKELVKLLTPALSLNLQIAKAEFWFTVFFPEAHTLVFENAAETTNKSAEFFMPTKTCGGSVDHLGILQGEKVVGYYHYHNGGLFHIECHGVHMPLRKWEDEYMQLYNQKYGTNYITFNQGCKQLTGEPNNWMLVPFTSFKEVKLKP